jgi:hypothetical protein
MSAYELASKLEKVSNDMEHGFLVNDWKLLFESALVLRKQAQEIEALKKSFDVLRSAYISVSGGLEVSLELNKAQALRNGGEK